MNENNAAIAKQEKIGISAFISKDTRDKLLPEPRRVKKTLQNRRFFEVLIFKKLYA